MCDGENPELLNTSSIVIVHYTYQHIPCIVDIVDCTHVNSIVI